MPEPRESETKDEYIPRCIKFMMDEGKYPQKQCIAICYSMWKNKGKKNEGVDVEDKMMAYVYEEGTTTSDIDKTIAGNGPDTTKDICRKKKKKTKLFKRLQNDVNDV
jgi:hypothetical protein